MGYGKQIIEKFDTNGVFSDEQREVLGKVLEDLAKNIDDWMYNEVLPKTINANDEVYGEDPETSYGIIEKVKTLFNK